MTHDLFLSYKSGDVRQAARLAQALERAGFSVWWDRALVPAESWREAVAEALAAARLVLVLWTPASTGPEGSFVRDEAAHGLKRGALVPVTMARTTPPLGFGEVHALDLVGWRGSPRDPRFEDLVALLHARLNGAEPPKMQGRMRLALQRMRLGAAALGASGAIAFAADVNSIQVQICSLPPRPVIADGCGALGLGGQPTRAERLAWAAVSPRSCPALAAHVSAFPDGVYRARAADLYAARRQERRESWIPAERRLPLTVIVKASADDAARKAALAADAARLCGGFAATGNLFRLIAARAGTGPWECGSGAGGGAGGGASGIECKASGEAICALERHELQEVEICGPIP